MDNKNKKQFGFKFNIFWMYAIIGIALFSLFYMQDTSAEREVNWQPEFTSYLESDGVTSIVVYPEDNKIEAALTDSLAREVFKGQQGVNLKKAKVIVKVTAASLEK